MFSSTDTENISLLIILVIHFTSIVR